MTPSQQAKQLGAQSLHQVAEFYGCTTQHLRNMHKRNEIGFKAMVIGCVTVSCGEVKRDKELDRLRLEEQFTFECGGEG